MKNIKDRENFEHLNEDDSTDGGALFGQTAHGKEELKFPVILK